MNSGDAWLDQIMSILLTDNAFFTNSKAFQALLLRFVLHMLNIIRLNLKVH